MATVKQALVWTGARGHLLAELVPSWLILGGDDPMQGPLSSHLVQRLNGCQLTCLILVPLGWLVAIQEGHHILVPVLRICQNDLPWRINPDPLTDSVLGSRFPIRREVRVSCASHNVSGFMVVSSLRSGMKLSEELILSKCHIQLQGSVQQVSELMT